MWPFITTEIRKRVCDLAIFKFYLGLRSQSIGGMPERLNGTVLKTVKRDERFVGSNPTSSSNTKAALKAAFVISK